jgi:hypothetical protein
MKSSNILILGVALLASVAFEDFAIQQSMATNSIMLAQNDLRSPPRDRIDNDRVSRNDADLKRSNDQTTPNKPDPITKSGVQQCPGEFALCASSTCKPTGRNIKVNVNGGKSTVSYPEVVCTCPIITEAIAMANGVALSGLAGVNEGNMKGSCAVPSPDKIWSLFSPLKMYPQESANPPFQRDNQNMFKQQTCSQGTGSNCWSFICTRDKGLTNGTRTATCSCPAGENPFGAPTKNSEFLTGAGSQRNAPQTACMQYPVSIPNIADYK